MPPTTHPERRARTAIYVRISEDKREQAGVRRQEKECRELAERLGWNPVAVYADNDLEASSGKPRPGYDLMVEAMKAGKIDSVIGWHSDRIYRRPDELEDLIKIADAHDVQFAAVKVGRIDLSTASGRMVARMLGAAAKYEVELKGERQASQLKQRRELGLPSGGGTRPFGWEDDGMTIRPAEAAVIRDIVGRAIAGESVGSITEGMVAANVPTPSWKGVPFVVKSWHPTVVRRLLTNPRLAGLMTYKGDVVGQGAWEPIIDEATHRRVVEVLRYRGPARRNTGRIALLPGLIWCAECKYELVTFRQQRGAPPPGIRTYGCRTRYMPGRPGHLESCGRISIKAEAIEQDVAERLLADFARPRHSRKLAAAAGDVSDPAVTAAAQIAEVEERLRSLGADYGDGLLGRTEFLAARDRMTARLDELHRAAGAPQIDAPISDPAALAAWWEGASVGQQQALLRTRIDRIEVGRHAGRRSHYDPSRVTIFWR